MEKMEVKNENGVEVIQNLQNESTNEQEEIVEKNGRLSKSKKTKKSGLLIKFPKIFNATTMVAFAALLVSFLTTLISYIHTKEQDVQNQKTELRMLLQRIIALPKENAEIMSKYSDNPSVQGTLGDYISQENMLLFNQITSLEKDIPSDRISAMEYFSISTCLMNAGNYPVAKEYIEKALDKINNSSRNDYSVEIAIIRQSAFLFFCIGDYENGRKEFEKALNIFDKYKDQHFHAHIKLSSHLQTELNWAVAEASSYNFDKIYIHIKNAKKYLNELPDIPGRENFEKQIYNIEMQMGALIQSDDDER